MGRKKFTQPKIWQIFLKTISSKWFFISITIFFFAEMAWIALSAIYPMLFDEEYHLGIIDIYARQISPFINSQPTEASFHGDITRYGSYLFHYLMSFPYRFISIFTDDLPTKIIAMRFICICIVIGGFVFWRNVLVRFGVSKALAHIVLFIFTLIPLIPFALSQINYDSLAFFCIPLIFYLAIRSTEAGKRQSLWIIYFIGVSALASLVKFTILPIALGAAIYISIFIYKKDGKKILKKQIDIFKKLSKNTKIISLIFLSLALFLFIERYGVNLVSYHAIEPKCHKVQSIESCMEYTVWRRDTTWKEANDKKGEPRDSALNYTTTYWVPHIFNDFFVTAAFVYKEPRQLEIRYLPSGPGSMQSSAGSQVLRYGGWAVLAMSIIAVILSSRYLWLKYRHLSLITAVILVIYMFSLWIRNYTDYLSIGAGTAAQGRYFIPLLIPVFAVVAISFNHIFKRIWQKTIFIIICILLLSQGGGVMNYMLYSNSKWYWPDGNSLITSVNKSAQKFLRVFIRF